VRSLARAAETTSTGYYAVLGRGYYPSGWLGVNRYLNADADL
jgi:hypothetical protein